MRGRGIHQRANRLRRQGDSLFNRRQLRLKFRYSRGGLFLLTGDLAKLREQTLPAFIVIIDDERRRDSGELIVKRQRGVAAGGANQNEIRHLRGDRFGIRFADVQPGDMASLCYVAPLAHKPLIVGKAVIRRSGSAGDDGRINRQQRACQRHAGRDDTRGFVVQSMNAAAVLDLPGPTGVLG